MTVTGHVPNGDERASKPVEAGMDQINHIQYLPADHAAERCSPEPGVAAPLVNLESAEAKQAIEFLKKHGTVIDPTIALMELIIRIRQTAGFDLRAGHCKSRARTCRAAQSTCGVPAAEAPRCVKLSSSNMLSHRRCSASRRHSHHRRNRPGGARSQPASRD